MPAMVDTKAEQKAPVAKGTGGRKTVDKWKKKKWYTILSSRIFDKKVLGETPVEKPKNLINRTMKVTLDVLTGQRMKRDYMLTFKVFDVQGQTASTKISEFAVNRGSLGRTVRRRNSKVAIVGTIPSIGGEAKSTIMAITDRKATQSQEAAIRKMIHEEYASLKGKDFEELVQILLGQEFSNEIFKKASKICRVKKVIVSKSTFLETK
ncbi:MAG: hypothetical protein AABW59_01270 [archaeon]